MNDEKQLKFKIFLAFMVIYLVWGSTYLAIRLAIDTIPPFLMAGIRFTLSGLMLFFWRRIKENKVPQATEWSRSALVGILLLVGGNGTLTWSEQFIPSGLAALILATIPIWMVLLDWLFVVRKRPALSTMAGILLGVTGVGLLSGLHSDVLLPSAGADSTVFFYASMLILAAISWSSGSLYSRTIKSSSSLLMLVSIQMLSGGIALILLGTTRGEWAQISFTRISLISLGSMGYLIVFGTLLTYSAYNWLLRQTEPAKVGTYAFFNPLVAVFLGWLILSEPVTLRMIIGASCILSAVLIVNQSDIFRRILKQSHWWPSRPQK